MCLLSLSRETESISSLSCNLDHCNQCCIHQPQSIHQSDLQTGIPIHPSVKMTPKTNNEKIVAMWSFSHWAGKLSPSPCLAPLSCNLDHCNRRCIHQPQSIHQSDLQTGILIHPSVKPTPKTNNEKIVHTCKNLIPMVVTSAMAHSSKNHALLMCRIWKMGWNLFSSLDIRENPLFVLFPA